MANSAAMKMIVGSTWNAKITAVLRALRANRARHRPAPDAGMSPNGPKTNAAPTPANPSSFVM